MYRGCNHLQQVSVALALGRPCLVFAFSGSSDLAELRLTKLGEILYTRIETRLAIVRSAHPFLAAVDRLVHHASIFEMNAESYRRKAAEKVKGPGRPPQKASPADILSD